MPGPTGNTLRKRSELFLSASNTLYINLSELIRHLPGNDGAFANMPLADMILSQNYDEQ